MANSATKDRGRGVPLRNPRMVTSGPDDLAAALRLLRLSVSSGSFSPTLTPERCKALLDEINGTEEEDE